MKQIVIDENLTEQLRKITARLFDIENAVKFLLYCFEAGIHCEKTTELYCVGNALQEYLETTYANFKDIEKAMDVD